jgi:hypothetical protein
MIMMRTWLIIGAVATTLPLAACDGPAAPADVGPTYVAPAGMGPVTVPENDLPFEYVATAQREQQIKAGYANLQVGASREDVRRLIGPPDGVGNQHPRRGGRFLGFTYTYKIRTTAHMTRTYDEYVTVFFDGSHKLRCTMARIPGFTDIGKMNDQ